MASILRLLVLCFVLFGSINAQVPSYVPKNGLVGWWGFNGNANDESGNNYHFTVNGAALSYDRYGKINRAYKFDGINDFIDCLIPQQREYTYSIWVNYEDFKQTNQTVFSHKNYCSRGSGPLLCLTGNQLRLSMYNCGECSANSSGCYLNMLNIAQLNPNVWYHIALTANSTSGVFSIYINGQLITSFTSSRSIQEYGKQPLALGKFHDASDLYYTKAIKDEIGLWNRVLTVSEISDLYKSNQPLALEGTTLLNVSCYNGNDGIATVTPIDGRPPYTYEWNTSPKQNTQTAKNLKAGIYNVTVTDSDGAFSTISVVVSQPSQLQVRTPIITSSIKCYGDSNGVIISDVVQGGTPPYTYKWNDNPIDSTPTLANLKAGLYKLTVIDKNGCSSESSITLTQPSSPLKADDPYIEKKVSCAGASDAIVKITNPTGGKPPYTIVWNTIPPSYSNVISNAKAGSYTVTISDVNGCITNKNITVPEPEKIVITQPRDTIVMIQTKAVLNTASNNPNSTFQWQTNIGTGFQDLENVFQYNGTKTRSLIINEVNSYNNNQPFRCIIKTINCFDTTKIVNLKIRTNVDVHENQQVSTISISPNPTGESDQFIIRFAENQHQDISIELLDILGSVHYSNSIQAGSETFTIPVQGLSSGMYMLRVRMNNEVYIEKVIVN